MYYEKETIRFKMFILCSENMWRISYMMHLGRKYIADRIGKLIFPYLMVFITVL